MSLVTLYNSLAHQLMWVKNYGGKRKRLFRLGCNAEFHFIGLASSLCKFLPLRYTLLCANVLGILIKKRPIHHNYELVAQTMYPDSCKVQPICICGRGSEYIRTRLYSIQAGGSCRPAPHPLGAPTPSLSYGWPHDHPYSRKNV